MFLKPKLFVIEFDPSKGTIQAGEILSGRVRLDTSTFIHQLLGIRVVVRGGAKVHWTEQVKEGVGKVKILIGRTVFIFVHSTEPYLNCPKTNLSTLIKLFWDVIVEKHY